MRSLTLLLRTIALAGLVALAFGACSGSSPKSAKPKRTVLYSQYDDARVGREGSEEVARSIGVVEDPELDAYVNEIGRKLLRGVPRSNFQYQFKVVDQYEPNAFALPGGYIFISRGLLVLTNDEDEIANVIGHEITHSARRHAAAQQALARHSSPLSMPWTRAATMAAYGRDMEREADRGGQMLAAAAGYDPMGMSTFLKSLGQMERFILGFKRLPTFFDTHPGSPERAAGNAARANEIRWKRDASLGDTRMAHLRHIDGLALEQRPESGIFVGDRFLHPDLDFQLRFPRGWTTNNSAQAVGAMAPRRDAIVFLTVDLPKGDPREIAQLFVEKTREEQPVEVKEWGPVKVGHIDGWRVHLENQGRGGRVVMITTLFPYGDATWRITGMTPASSLRKYSGALLNTSRSFRPLTREDRDSIESKRLRLVTAQAGEDLVALGRRTGNAWDPGQTAVVNGVFVNHRFEGGETVKIARVEPYRSSAR
ncbi:MAG: M48 family metalloprotease [Myxococcota bacterium]